MHLKGKPVNKRVFIMLLSISILLGLVTNCKPQTISTPAAPTPAADLITLATSFVDSLAKEDYASAFKMFDTTMARAMPPEKLRETWKTLLTQVGTFKRQAGNRTEKSGQFDIVYVTCEFEQATLDIKVVFNSAKEVSGLWFVPHQTVTAYQAPAYAKLNAFREQEVMVGSGDLALPGTLSIPKGTGPFPALVLVHGSGPNDRDETVEANKPFRDLAWGLASQGIAVLRYEKRTKAHPEQFVATKDSLTVKEEVINDALAAVALLRKTKDIDPQRVFVLGHSLGGTLAPRIGKADAQIAGFVILAGATRPLEDLMLYQVTYLASLDSNRSESDKADIEQVRQAVERIKDPNLASTAKPDEMLLGAPISYWLDLRGYKPAEMAAELKQPMLILQGERDYQVPLEEFEGWKQALSSRANVEFKLYPKLNHLFIAGEGSGSPTEYQTPGHVDEEVINDIAAWISAH
jgi:hypothetical protein